MEVRGFPASSMPCCIFSLFLLQLPSQNSVTAQMKVIGPGEPIKVQVGGDAKLNCYLEPKMDAQGMEVRWFRSQLSPAVHVYEHGQDQTGDQMKEYQGRTELLKDTITDGNLTLKISPVRVSDDGEYRCFFQHGGNSENTTLQLQVTAVGSEPQIRLEGHEMKGIWLGCMTTGWYPAPQVRWKDARGEMVPSWSESLSQDTDGLFAVKLSVLVQEGFEGNVSCSLESPLLPQGKEAGISIAVPVHLRVSTWLVVMLGVIVLFLLPFLACAGYFIWKLHKE
ncbi:butyrophilin subfamily 1 member A1-like [Ornithorhynchus anatinus]|uniref:butyrophilin subfamily 1 member A1-like n=1 Tax=Ornithorhynchus anatinus TaxID=9258 RepID=UPI0010A8B00C|nr:butyrophilin subfamily 1 member A1-like [Ornithorhynchus anatinus]